MCRRCFTHLISFPKLCGYNMYRRCFTHLISLLKLCVYEQTLFHPYYFISETLWLCADAVSPVWFHCWNSVTMCRRCFTCLISLLKLCDYVQTLLHPSYFIAKTVTRCRRCFTRPISLLKLWLCADAVLPVWFHCWNCDNVQTLFHLSYFIAETLWLCADAVLAARRCAPQSRHPRGDVSWWWR